MRVEPAVSALALLPFMACQGDEPSDPAGPPRTGAVLPSPQVEDTGPRIQDETASDNPISAETRARVIALDPAFGSDETLERVAEQKGLADAKIEEEALVKLMSSLRPHSEDIQRQRTERLFRSWSVEDGAATLAFLESASWKNVVQAQEFWLRSSFLFGESRWREALRIHSDPELVGENATKHMMEQTLVALEAMGKDLAKVMELSRQDSMAWGTAVMIEPDDARALQTFLATDAGQRWLRTRSAAGELTGQRLRKFRTELAYHGALPDTAEVLERAMNQVTERDEWDDLSIPEQIEKTRELLKQMEKDK